MLSFAPAAAPAGAPSIAPALYPVISPVIRPVIAPSRNVGLPQPGQDLLPTPAHDLMPRRPTAAPSPTISPLAGYPPALQHHHC